MTQRGLLVGSHPLVREALEVLDRVAASSCTVLVTGESGTGKELAVAALHDASGRADGPLVAVNCGAIPESLVESELFGHAKGAFTGAMTARTGHVHAAEGGTLFLDEVGELSLAVQVKLLRLLQSREYTPVGETRVVRSNARIVAATNRDLEKEVREGRFREDLYYRLNVIQVRLPALRERRADIARIANALLPQIAERTGRDDVVGFTEGAIEQMTNAPWPGNVRELENAIERAVLLCREPLVRSTDLVCPEAPRAVPQLRIVASVPAPALHREAKVSTPRDEGTKAIMSTAAVAPAVDRRLFRVDSSAVVDLRAAVEAYENRLLKSALRRAGFNKTRAAQMLGLHRTTLIEMLKRKGIDRAA